MKNLPMLCVLLTMLAGAVMAAGAADPQSSAATAGAEPKPGVDGPTPYPDPKNEAAWPGKGPIRSFGFMVGERKAFWKNRDKDQGAVVFVGDSLTGGWKNLAKDFPKFNVANRGLGGDTSRGAYEPVGEIDFQGFFPMKSAGVWAFSWGRNTVLRQVLCSASNRKRST